MIDLIVLQCGQSHLTVRLLESLRDSGSDARVILVDNGSPESDVDAAEALLHETDILILNDENLGYAGGNNEGLRASTAEFVVIQNNDTILFPGVLERMAAHASAPDVGAVGPLCNPNESAQSFAFSPIPTEIQTAAEPWRELATHYAGITLDVDMLAGFSLMLPRRTIDTVGLLSEDYGPGGYGADDDYCHRIRAAGLRLLLAYDCYVHHDQRATSRVLHGDDGIEEQGQAGLRLLAERYG